MTSVLILLAGFDPGTYVIEDDGDPTNGIAQLRSPDGSVIFFNIPTEFLTVTASAGRDVVFNLTESFGAADINVGSLTNSADNPDSITIRSIAGAGDVLLATNGAITEGGSDVAADIGANTLIMSAGTGVGTGANAIETQVGTLEAETVTGGIAIGNLGGLTIGGLTDDVVGLDVETSGNLVLTNVGAIDINEAGAGAFESIHGGTASGDVSLIATGFDADIRSLVDIDFLAAPGGNVLLQAGRDVLLGTQGLNFDNDVRARGSLTINAGRDVTVDGFADLASDGFGAATGGNLVVNAGRDVNLLNSTGTDGSLGAEGSGGADVVLNTGPGGFLRLLATSTSTLFSSSGNVTVNADRMVIAATAGITASSGSVFIQPRTAGWDTDLGSATDGAFALEMSDAELDRIFTPNLDIGSFGAGRVTVSSAISPASATNLHLRAGTDIRFDAGVTVTAGLALRAGDNIHQLGAAAIVAGGAVSAFVDQVGDDGGLGGIATLNGTVTAVSVALNGNGEVDTLNGSGAGETLSGAAGNDTLRGFGGNDTLIGGTGADAMDGGLGDDLFFIDNAGDTVAELVGEGTDRVYSTMSYALAAGISIETLSTDNPFGLAGIAFLGNELGNTIYGNYGDNTLDGSGGNDTLNGYSGNDTLIGGTGTDSMAGEAGNDNFFVDNAGDTVVETAGQGTDRVYASVTYTLGAGVSVETLSTDNPFGVAAITLTGNELVNTVYGNFGNNVLYGGGGNDTLNGYDGDDVILGGTGADAMTGSNGNDSFYVDNAGDTVVEVAGQGTDRIYASVTYTLAAGVSVETLSTDNPTGLAAITLTGNELGNTVYGNYGANALYGGGGNDTIAGYDGDDVIVGGSGADAMAGGIGNDSFYIDNAGDTVAETVGQGTDRIYSTMSYALAAGVSVETLSTDNPFGVAGIAFLGNELGNTIYGNFGDNTLDGSGGNDTLNGYSGNDTLIGGAGSDVLTGEAGADAFRFDSALGVSNVDMVTDYVVADDVIQLDDAVFTGLGLGVLAAGAFNTGAAATQADDRIIYNSATGALLFDADGVGGAAGVQFAVLSTGLAMTSAEFIVI